MIIRLIYRALRLLAVLIIIFAVMIIMTKGIPAIENFINKVIYYIKDFYSQLTSTLKSLSLT